MSEHRSERQRARSGANSAMQRSREEPGGSVTRPTPLTGFPELLPAQRFVELEVLDRLRRTFELHGFAPVETRAAEPLDQLLRKGEIDKEVYVLRRLHATGDDATELGPALRPHRTVRPLRPGKRRAAGVPVPPLPDPEGMARRAPAGGALPRVHPGRHRRRRTRRAAVPPRRRGGSGHGRGLGAAVVPAGAAPAGQQPQVDRGLLPRARRTRRARGDAGDRPAGQDPGRGDRGDARRRRPAQHGAGGDVPGARPDPHARHVFRSAGARSRHHRRAARSGPGRARRRDRGMRADHRRPFHRRGRPAHCPRVGLLHRHRLRDPDGRLRGRGFDLLGRTIRLVGG